MGSYIRIFIAVALLSFIFCSVPRSASAKVVNIDEYELKPGAARYFDLVDFDEKGDLLDLTIVFRRNETGEFQGRAIEVSVVESGRATFTDGTYIIHDDALLSMSNLSSRLNEQVENTKDKQMAIMLLNPFLGPQDNENTSKATVLLDIQYVVENVESEEESGLLVIILIILIIIVIIGLVVAGFLWFKRRSKDARTFYSGQTEGYYVFRDINGATYYFDQNQYAQLYNSNSLGNYEYLGRSHRMNGPIIPPEGELGLQEGYDQDYVEMSAPVSAVPMEAQPMDAYQQQGAPEGYPETAVGAQGQEAMFPPATTGEEGLPSAEQEMGIDELLPGQGVEGEASGDAPPGNEPSQQPPMEDEPGMDVTAPSPPQPPQETNGEQVSPQTAETAADADSTTAEEVPSPGIEGGAGTQGPTEQEGGVQENVPTETVDGAQTMNGKDVLGISREGPDRENGEDQKEESSASQTDQGS